MISLLIPSYKRVDRLRGALRNARETCGRSLEIIIRLDHEDGESLAAINELVQDFQVLVMVGEHRRGYADLHFAWNEMARAAQGVLLILSNDDVRFETPEWGRIVQEAHEKAQGGLYFYWLDCDSTNYGWPAFPIVPKELVHRGHPDLTKFCGVDSWLVAAMGMEGSLRGMLPIKVRHERGNVERYFQFRDETFEKSNAFQHTHECLGWEERYREDIQKWRRQLGL